MYVCMYVCMHVRMYLCMYMCVLERQRCKSGNESDKLLYKKQYHMHNSFLKKCSFKLFFFSV